MIYELLFFESVHELNICTRSPFLSFTAFELAQTMAVASSLSSCLQVTDHGCFGQLF